MSDSKRFLVDSLFPLNNLHIIYGPSGAGRSILQRQLLKEISLSQPVFGQPSHPLPFVLMSTLDDQHDLGQHLADLGCDPTTTPHTSMLHGHKREEHTIEGAVRRARSICPDLRVLFLDGMTSLCPGNIMIYRECATFLIGVRDLCLAQNLTIIGTTSCGKSDEDNAHHKPLGSVAWNDHTSTRTIIDFAKPGKFDDPDRTVLVIPRRGPSIFGRYTIDHTTHLFIPNSQADQGIQKELDEWLARQQPGAEFSTLDIMLAGTQLGLGRSTIYNWVRDCLELGMILKVRHGIYTRAPIPTPLEIQ